MQICPAGQAVLNVFLGSSLHQVQGWSHHGARPNIYSKDQAAGLLEAIPAGDDDAQKWPTISVCIRGDGASRSSKAGHPTREDINFNTRCQVWIEIDQEEARRHFDWQASIGTLTHRAAQGKVSLTSLSRKPRLAPRFKRRKQRWRQSKEKPMEEE